MYAPLRNALSNWTASVVQACTTGNLETVNYSREALWVPGTYKQFYFGFDGVAAGAGNAALTRFPSYNTTNMVGLSHCGRITPVRDALGSLTQYLVYGVVNSASDVGARTISLADSVTYGNIPTLVVNTSIVAAVQSRPGQDVYMAGTVGATRTLWRIPAGSFPSGLATVTTNLFSFTGSILTYWVDPWTDNHYAVLVNGGVATLYRSTDVGATFAATTVTWTWGTPTRPFIKFASTRDVVCLVHASAILYNLAGGVGAWSSVALPDVPSSAIQVQDWLVLGVQPSSIRLDMFRMGSSMGFGPGLQYQRAFLPNTPRGGSSASGPLPRLATDGGRLYCFEQNSYTSGDPFTRMLWVSDAWGPSIELPGRIG